MDSDEDSRDPLLDPAGPNFVRSGLLFYGAMAIVAVLWRVGLYEERIFLAPGAAPDSGVHWLRDLGLGLGVGAAVIVLSNLATRLTDWGEKLARAMAEALGPISLPDALLLAFASGLAEEMFFRGALQPRVGFVLASLLFGLIHFVPRREFYPWTGFAVVVGFVFGWLFEYTGALLAPIAAHTLINGINLPMLIRQYAPESPTHRS
ncbi:MAG: CPBP family intramembrane metalloprotease [bacterium]|nr:CPBP family intramembrane metalloprotease [bacterium]